MGGGGGSGAAEPSFTAMPRFADVGEEGEELRYALYSSLMHGYNVGLRYIDDRLAAAPPPPSASVEDQVEEGESELYQEGSPPPEDVPYERIEEQPDEIHDEQMEVQPVEEDAAAVDTAADAASEAETTETSMITEREQPSEQATKVTVHMYRTEEPRTIGSPPSYRRPEPSQPTKERFHHSSLCQFFST